MGQADGLIPGTKWELPAGSSVRANWLSLSCMQDLCVVQHCLKARLGLQNSIAQHSRGLIAQVTCCGDCCLLNVQCSSVRTTVTPSEQLQS